ncbi:hypothetical protein ANCCAN_04273 [Ancylostoma caninum]|uniref:Uncharacterized protein n=1 Tax=Ancylostoma caninum TaxID=29170 RepID=A0A368H207_ANCCA|nr:hypothetical protein ANCCAN_04273 [Ancylostoma caninum]
MEKEIESSSAMCRPRCVSDVAAGHSNIIDLCMLSITIALLNYLFILLLRVDLSEYERNNDLFMCCFKLSQVRLFVFSLHVFSLANVHKCFSVILCA